MWKLIFTLICRSNFSFNLLLTSCEPAFHDSSTPRHDLLWQKKRRWICYCFFVFLSPSPSFVTTSVSLDLLPHPLLLSSVLFKGNKSLPVSSPPQELPIGGSNGDFFCYFPLSFSLISCCIFFQCFFYPVHCHALTHSLQKGNKSLPVTSPPQVLPIQVSDSEFIFVFIFALSISQFSHFYISFYPF